MARGPLTFRQRDMRAAVKAVQQAGLSVSRVEVDKDGRIVLITSPDAAPERREGNEWDEALS